MVNSKILIVSGTPIQVIFQNSATISFQSALKKFFQRCFFIGAEMNINILQINEQINRSFLVNIDAKVDKLLCM